MTERDDLLSRLDKLKRFTPGGEWWDQMVEASYGRWLRLEDVAALLAEPAPPDQDDHYIPERDGRRCAEHPKADHELVCLTCLESSEPDLEAIFIAGVHAALLDAGSHRARDGRLQHPETLWAQYCDDANIAIRAPAQPAARTGWQDIATVPKDGKPVDLWCSSDDGVQQWREPDCIWIPSRKLWSNARGHWDCATHWMRVDPPLAVPAAPQERETCQSCGHSKQDHAMDGLTDCTRRLCICVRYRAVPAAPPCSVCGNEERDHRDILTCRCPAAPQGKET